MSIELIASRVIEQGREVLELYCVRRADGAADAYRLVWADAKPVGGRSKCRILDIRDYTAANHGERAKAAFRALTEGKAEARADAADMAEAAADTRRAAVSPYSPACEAVLAKADAKADANAKAALWVKDKPVTFKGKAGVYRRAEGGLHAVPTWGPLAVASKAVNKARDVAGLAVAMVTEISPYDARQKAEAAKASREAKAAAKAVPYANGWAVAEREALAAVKAAEAERDREAAKAKARVLAAVAEGKAEAIRREAEARAEAKAVAVAYSPASPAALAKAGRALAEAMPTRAEAEADPSKAAVAVAVARALLAVALKAEAASLAEAKARTAAARLALIKAEAEARNGGR